MVGTSRPFSCGGVILLYCYDFFEQRPIKHAIRHQSLWIAYLGLGCVRPVDGLCVTLHIYYEVSLVCHSTFWIVLRVAFEFL